jgi:hypothetical protein
MGWWPYELKEYTKHAKHQKNMKYGGMNGGVINPNGRNSMIFTNTIHAQVEQG